MCARNRRLKPACGSFLSLLFYSILFYSILFFSILFSSFLRRLVTSGDDLLTTCRRLVNDLSTTCQRLVNKSSKSTTTAAFPAVVLSIHLCFNQTGPSFTLTSMLFRCISAKKSAFGTAKHAASVFNSGACIYNLTGIQSSCLL